MFSNIKNWLLNIFTGLTLLLGVILFGKMKQIKEAKKDIEKSETERLLILEQLDSNKKMVNDSQIKQQKVSNVEKVMMDIDKQTHSKIKEEKQTRKGQKITFGKSLSILIICFLLSGCGYSLEQCRVKYPCPENVCIQVKPPVITKIQHPQLNVIDVDYDSKLDKYVLTYEQVESILSNEENLSILIQAYEEKIDIYNEWALSQ